MTLRERISAWLQRQWRGMPRQPPAPEEPLAPGLDRLAELMERGDPKDLEEIARRMQGP